MPPLIRIVSPQLQVPALEAPRLKAIDVASGLVSVAGGLEELGRVERAAKLNDAQIELSSRFRDLANELRSTPAEQKRQLFEERAAQIRDGVLGGADRGPVRDALGADFQRHYTAFGAQVDADAWSGLAANSLAKADEEADRLVGDIAGAKSPPQRDALITQLANLYGNLASANIIDAPTGRKRIAATLNRADLVAARTAIDDPNRDPLDVAKSLREGSAYSHLKPEQVLRLARRARNEAKRREGVAAAEAKVADAVRRQEAPQIVEDNVQSLLHTGHVLDDERLAVLDHLPADQAAHARAQLHDAERIFHVVGDLAAKSPGEIDEALVALKHEGPRVHEAALAYADWVLTERERDPAAAAAASIPSVASAWAAYDEDQTPGNLQSAARQSLAAQAQLGIARDHRRPLSGERAEAEARAVLSAPLEKQLEALRALRPRFGDLAGEVERQIAPFLPTKLREAAALGSPLKGDLMWRQAVADRTEAAGARPPQ